MQLNAHASIIPENEGVRMDAVHRYDILDTPPDGTFDRITALAARRFNVPISIISIVDEDRIWFKSHHGVPVNQIGRDPGPVGCLHPRPGSVNAQAHPLPLNGWQLRHPTHVSRTLAKTASRAK